jgi:hypothetical protein
VSCDPNTLLNDARCYDCLTEEQRAVINISLWCQILAAGTLTPVVADFRITELSELRITEAGDFRIIE